MKLNSKKILSYIMVFVLGLLPGLIFHDSVKAAETGTNTTQTEGTDSESPETASQQAFDSVYGFPIISSTSCVIMDADTGQVLYAKDPHSRQYPASITKILTAYLAIKNSDLNSTITMSDAAVWGIDRSSSHIALDVGEQLSLSDALYAVMLVSANEAAWAIAEHVSGTLQDFVQLMNDTAANLGCTNTHFTNANGLHDQNHYTSAYDMALITKEALSSNTFCKYAAETYHEIEPTNMNSEKRYLVQGNKMMLEDSGYYYAACKGGKTGYTDDAGGTLVVWAEKNDMRIICVTMGAENNTVNYEDSIRLFDYVFDNFKSVTPLSDFEFNAEDATRAQTFLNEYYDCENLGTMKLSVDTLQKVTIANNANADEFIIEFIPSAERLEEDYIGNLVITCPTPANMPTMEPSTISVPVSYSGYVNSKDDSEVRHAYENGEIRSALLTEKKSTKKIVVSVILILATIGLFIYANIFEPRKHMR